MGIIPALAGNTNKRGGRQKANGDHPRACGEHSLDEATDISLAGSSPRLRGTLSLQYVGGSATGIIPALAGNTTVRGACTSAPWDHPRACGEHGHSPVLAGVTVGSSPRLRGTLAWGVLSVVVFGIIPALAGNTRDRPIIAPRHRDHPRACGEHTERRAACPSEEGSSPRLRGTL